jgi:histone H3/H4
MQTGSDDPEEKQEDEEDDDDDDDDAPPAVEEQVQQPQPVVSKKLPVSLPQPMFHGIKLPSTSTSTSTTTAATAGVRVPRPSSHPEYVKPPKDDEDEDINEDDEEDDEDEADQAAAASAAASAATRRPISIGKGKMAGKGYRHSNTDRLNVAAPRGKTAAPILRHQFRYKKPHLEACISRPFTRRMAYGVGMKMISKEMCGVLRPLARHYLACVTKDALLLMNHSKRKTITSADVIMAMARHPIGSRVYT